MERRPVDGSGALAASDGYKPTRVVAGVLRKYVNLGKGWRDRLFVLRANQFSYFKLSGPDAVCVHQALLHFDPTLASVELIGAKVAVLMKDKTSTGADSTCVLPPAGATYDLGKARLRESESEGKKFYVRQAGMRTCTVTCETSDDRTAWVMALTRGRAADAEPRGALAHPATLIRAASIYSAAAASKHRFESTLADLRGGRTHLAVACDALEREFTELHSQLDFAMRQVTLKDTTLQALLDERRMLQTEIVLENRMDMVPDSLQSNPDTSSSNRNGDDVDVSDSRSSGSPRQVSEPGSDGFYDATESLRGSNASSFDGGRGGAGPTAPLAPAGAHHVHTPSGGSAGEAGGNSGLSCSGGGSAGVSAGLEPKWVKEEPDVQRRLALPPPAQVEKVVSLWSVIRTCVGKDLTRICLPVFFNEPLSALEKMAEDFEYSNLLDQAAAAEPGSIWRLIYTAAFAMSGYSASGDRPCKPFNPLLGETYEYVDVRRAIRMVAEKTVHHPTVLAAHVEGRGWTVDGDLEVKSRFWGRCIELRPVGYIQVRFHDGEVVTWNKVTTTINNLIMGRVYMEHGGVMKVASDTATRTEVRLKFRDGGLVSAGRRIVTGKVVCAGKELPEYRLTGKWDQSLQLSVDSAPPMELWRVSPPASKPTRYRLSQFAIQLNELTQGLRERLPPTDSRLRPDQAALEAGRYDEANTEKQRLEQKQRRARKEAEEGHPIQPRWFTPVPGAQRGEQLGFEYAGGYWEARRAGRYTGCRDIFGDDSAAAAS